MRRGIEGMFDGCCGWWVRIAAGSMRDWSSVGVSVGKLVGCEGVGGWMVPSLVIDDLGNSELVGAVGSAGG